MIETLEVAERLYPVLIKPILDVYDDGISNKIGEEDVNEDSRNAFIDGAKWQAERMNSDKDMIEFANWLRKEDTEENAEKYCNHSDSDMLQVFKDQ
jgi:hypothetical protein